MKIFFSPFPNSGPLGLIVVSMPKRRRNMGWERMEGRERPDGRRSRWTLDWSSSSFFLSFTVASAAHSMHTLSHSVVNVTSVCRHRYPRALPFVPFFSTNKYRPLLTSDFIVFVHADTIYILEPTHTASAVDCTRPFACEENSEWKRHFGNQAIRQCQRMRVFRLHDMPRDECPPLASDHAMDLAHCSTSTKIE